MRPERRQRLHDMRVLLRHETRAYTDHVLVSDVLLLLVRIAHCGPSVGWRASGRPLPRANPRSHSGRQFSGLILLVNAPPMAMSTSLARNAVRAANVVPSNNIGAPECCRRASHCRD